MARAEKAMPEKGIAGEVLMGIERVLALGLQLCS
jgi:hypothetical protein